MARRRRTRFAGAVCIALLGAWALWPRTGAPGIAVVGDGAPAVRNALPEGAVADIVLLRREGSLRHLPEVARLCRGRCDPGLTVLRVLGLGSGRRLVFEMSEMPGIAALDRGDPLPAPIVACILEAVAGETDCLPVRRFWVLPYGL